MTRLADAALRRSTRILAGAALAMLTAMTPAVASPSGTGPLVERHVYQVDEGVVANPERGFYHHTETHYFADGSGYQPLDVAVLRGFRDEGVTQVIRVFYLEKFVDTDALDPAWLALVAADFEAARSAGVSVIVRFAYAKGGAWPYSPPYGDAPPARAVLHIAQLGPVLRASSDVIATIQSGFVGLWGEGYFTDHYSADPNDPGHVTEANWADRGAIVRALLDAAPRLTVQVRTMQMKQKIFGTTSGTGGALSKTEAFTGSDISRVGHHNDCFLAAPDDWGTFLTDPLSLDQDYLAQDTRYAPMGGETCNVNPPRSEWPTASVEMAAYHYSYLNADYHRGVLESWGEGEQIAQRKLGYRLSLKQAELATMATRHRSFPISVEIDNSGWAAPYNQRRVLLVMESDSGIYQVPLANDPREWAAGTTATITASVCAAVPAGDYRLHLWLPSAHERTRTNPDYAIRLANWQTWVADSGWNDLQHSVRVTSDGEHAGGNGCAGGIRPVELG